MKKIDLDSMSEEKLRFLNREIVRRLEFYSSIKRRSQLMSFRIGDRVEFDADFGIISGTIVRINQKTATIETDDGRGWRVAPGLLRKLVDAPEARSEQTNLFQFPTNAGKNP